MVHLLDGSLEPATRLLLLVALAVALGFEFVNGFHDTANAVATVIYTNTMSPRRAVLWSGLCNFAGVYLGGTAVAFSIVRLLPVDLLVAIGSSSGMAMVLALLSAAILWNLGTWYLAIPASSSHTLIGAILGVGLAHSSMGGRFGSGVNWGEASLVGLSLLISPMVGFALAAVLLLVMKAVWKDPVLFEPPRGEAPPPPWIRGTLFATCTGVSLAHGSNDGQKGIGLIMLILIGILPTDYALDLQAEPARIERAREAALGLDRLLADRAGGGDATRDPLLRERLGELSEDLAGVRRFAEVPRETRWEIRTDILRIDDAWDELLRDGADGFSPAESQRAEHLRGELRSLINYAPTWVIAAVALALGLGTTVGWKRIVVTVGEKIGKVHLSYAQGAAAEVVAMTTIGLADFGGLPVSTTHVLSSGVAGTMAANQSGLQLATVRSIALAWVLTLPATMFLSAVLFVLFLRVIALFS